MGKMGEDERGGGGKREEGRREEKLKRTRTFRFNKILLGGPREFVRRTAAVNGPHRASKRVYTK